MTEVVRYTEPTSLELMPSAWGLAEKIAKTDFVPAAMRGKPEAVLAAILTGHELGIAPMQALAKINVIEGRPAMSAELMRAVVLAHGHELVVVNSNGTACTVMAKRKDSDRESTFTWTMDDAKRAGLDGKSNWRKYPRAMLMARATSEAVRAVFPDVVAGVSYSAEELTDGDYLDLDDVTATDEAPPKGPAAKKAKAAKRATAGPKAVDPPAEPEPAAGETPPLPGEDDEAPDAGEPPTLPRTLSWAQRFAIRCRELGMDDDERHALILAATGGRVESSKDVTGAEMDVLDAAVDHLAHGDPAFPDAPPVGAPTPPDDDPAIDDAELVPDDPTPTTAPDPDAGTDPPADADGWRGWMRTRNLRVPDVIRVAIDLAPTGTKAPGTIPDLVTDSELAAAVYAHLTSTDTDGTM